MAKASVKPAIGELPRLRMTYEEFLARFDENAHVEWVNGEAIVHMPPTEPHQDVVTLLVTLLRFYVDLRDLGMVLTAPFELRLATGSSREPDILFLARECPRDPDATLSLFTRRPAAKRGLWKIAAIYSQRRAASGSRRAARRAGSQLASSAIAGTSGRTSMNLS